MSERRYLVLTIEDAQTILAALRGHEADTCAIQVRLAADTGADIEEIVALLKALPLCPACVIEGQERFCNSLGAQKLGRRLARLLERARGERSPGEKP